MTLGQSILESDLHKETPETIEKVIRGLKGINVKQKTAALERLLTVSRGKKGKKKKADKILASALPEILVPGWSAKTRTKKGSDKYQLTKKLVKRLNEELEDTGKLSKTKADQLKRGTRWLE